MGLALTLRVDSPQPRRREPVTCGIPFPRASLADASAIRLVDGTGQPVPVQARTLDRWSDGSVRWLLLDWQANISGESATYQVGFGGPVAAPVNPISTRLHADGVDIDTGAARFEIRSSGLFPFAAFSSDGRPLLEPSQSGFVVEDEQGRMFRPRISRVWLDEAGPMRAKVCLEGDLRSDSSSILTLFAELDFYAGSGVVRFRCTLRNPRPASHPGGTWDLGSGGSVFLRDASLSITLAGEAIPSVACSPEIGHPLAPIPCPMELYQDSSGGENWQSSNHLDRHRQISPTSRGYRFRDGSGEREGMRATPIVTMETPTAFVAAVMPGFWQNFPKAIEVNGKTLTLRLFPKQSRGGHEIQGGEQKTHTVYLTFGRDDITDIPLDWCRSPSIARADPEWYAASGAIPYLTPNAWPGGTGYEQLIDSAIEGPHRFKAKREVIDEFGWRHFGEIYGDHEAVFHKGPTPLISHFNNQYDPIFGFAVQFLRSGDRRWWRQMDELAWHVLDIDTYHTDGDQSRYNRGLFWHTVHYIDADTATHRTYPRKGSAGGGPANEQNYATGLMLHHFLTGERLSRQTAMDLARWVIDMDDGRKSIFRWLAGGSTGLASSSRTPEYHGPGRGSGNSLAALLDGHRLTREAVFLDKAEELIRRVIHPADDVPARDLLDAENRWFYTMFLQSLGKYLDHKAELGQVDQKYAYGRVCLLLYARWMADHEYPYLEKPDRLEFPTETWAAQDMRKSEVFWFAWLHAEGAERERFREKAKFFYDYSTTTLAGMPTRHLCRPVVLLLSHGFRQGWFEQHADARAPSPPTGEFDFGRPEVFVPQKAKAIRRFKQLVLLGLISGLLSLVGLGWFLWDHFFSVSANG